MNYFFFLDPANTALESSVELFNKPPIRRLNRSDLFDSDIVAFYSNGNKWISHTIDRIKINEYKIIFKKDLPGHFKDQSVYISLFKNDFTDGDSLIAEESMQSIPEWRSNIKISSKTCSCSYQGEYPSAMTEKKISVVSCSPMIQIDHNFLTTFYLVNLSKNAKIEDFDLEILSPNKKILLKSKMRTNTINAINLNNIDEAKNYKMLIFKSEKNGGIPLYFSRNQSNTMMSIEHTHPPSSYLVFGTPYYFQAKKKSYWFDK